jgi:hypothetical protein
MGVQTCAELLRHSRECGESNKLRFAQVGDRDVYNPTAPFSFGGERLLAARVEARHTEISETVFFSEAEDGVWHPHPGAPVWTNLQDPCVAFFGDELVLGGVELDMGPGGKINGWSMPFFRGRHLEELRCFARGPRGMKDIRLVDLGRDGVGVATRPQGKKGGRGTVGWVVLDRLEDLTPQVLDDAPLLTGQFVPEEWGGANQLHLLKDGGVGVLGHIACFGSGTPPSKHYYPMVFRLDPATAQVSPMRILATRADFPPGPAKRAELADVVFSGGLVRLPDGRAELYAGLGDAEIARLEVDDPFIAYETNGN